MACGSAPQIRRSSPQYDRWVLVDGGSRIFVAAEDCSQGPYDVILPAAKTRWGRRVVVRVRSPRPLPLQVQLFVSDREVGKLAFNLDDDTDRAAIAAGHARCRATNRALAPGPVAKPAPPPAPPRPSKTGRRDAPPPPPPAPQPASSRPTRELATIPEANYEVRYRHNIAFELWSEDPAPRREEVDVQTFFYGGQDAGPLKVRFFAGDVLDLEGVVFAVSEEYVQPTIPDADYEQIVAGRIRGSNQQLAHCRAHPDDCKSIGNAASEPPPAPLPETRPPPPRPDAVWIAGAWRWSGVRYEWQHGDWRVPESASPPPARPHVTATTPGPAAPPEPPPLRAEVVPPAPATGAVWIAGYWAWDGRAYAWIAGEWKVPPTPKARWQPPSI